LTDQIRDRRPKRPCRLNAWAGATLAIAAAVAFAFSTVLARIAYGGGSNATTVASLRFCVPVVVLAFWFWASRRSLALSRKGVAIACLMGALTATYSLALLSAVSIVPIAQGILIFYLFPVVLTVILVLLRWEKLNFKILASIGLAVAGLALTLNPQASSLKLEGLILAFGAAFGFALVIALSSYGSRQNDARLMTLYMSGIAAATLMIFSATEGQFLLPSTGTGWLGFIGSAASYTFALIAFFVAIPLIGPMRVSLLAYAEPLTTAVLGALFLGESLAWPQVVGIGLTVSALVGVTMVTSGSS
jgi:drug/metabolite transporter (DMT)-like permease